ncbi:hypothetical protein [Haladaptatus sp. NG-WS-4]
MVQTRSPSSQHLYPSLEMVGNDRVNEGRQHTKTRPVRGCTPSSSAEYGRWHDPCPPTFQP